MSSQKGVSLAETDSLRVRRPPKLLARMWTEKVKPGKLGLGSEELRLIQGCYASQSRSLIKLNFALPIRKA